MNCLICLLSGGGININLDISIKLQQPPAPVYRVKQPELNYFLLQPPPANYREVKLLESHMKCVLGPAVAWEQPDICNAQKQSYPIFTLMFTDVLNIQRRSILAPSPCQTLFHRKQALRTRSCVLRIFSYSQVAVRKQLGSCQVAVRQLLGSCQVAVRQLLGSCLVAVWQLLGSCWVAVGQLLGSCYRVSKKPGSRTRIQLEKLDAAKAA